MDIDFDSAASSQDFDAFGLTFAHTCSGDQRLLVVKVAAECFWGGENEVNLITYNGVALTPIVSRDRWPWRVELWYLKNPAAGSHDVVVWMVGECPTVAAGSVSLTGVEPTSPLDDSDGADGSSTTGGSVTLTSTEDNCWAVDVFAADGAVTNLAVGAGQTERWKDENFLLDSGGSTEGPKTPAGDMVMSWTFSAAANKVWLMAAANFKPYVPPEPYISRPSSVRLRGPLFSLTARGWLGGYTYHHRYVCRNPYPIGLLPTIFRGYRMPAFGLKPYPQFIAQYYSTAGWIYQLRRTWHGMVWIAYAGRPWPFKATAIQIARRKLFAEAVAGWQALTGLQKGVWNSYHHPRHTSGYNKYIRSYMKDLPGLVK